MSQKLKIILLSILGQRYFGMNSLVARPAWSSTDDGKNGRLSVSSYKGQVKTTDQGTQPVFSPVAFPTGLYEIIMDRVLIIAIL